MKPVEIINYDEKPKESAVAAEFSAVLEKQTLNFVKLMRSKKGKYYLAFPAKGIQRDGGKTDWIPYNFFPKEREDEIKKGIMEALKPFVADLSLF